VSRGEHMVCSTGAQTSPVAIRSGVLQRAVSRAALNQWRVAAKLFPLPPRPTCASWGLHDDQVTLVRPRLWVREKRGREEKAASKAVTH
jgi:hypothetical protein